MTDCFDWKIASKLPVESCRNKYPSGKTPLTTQMYSLTQLLLDMALCMFFAVSGFNASITIPDTNLSKRLITNMEVEKYRICASV